MSDKYYRLVTLLVDISTKVLLKLFLDRAKKDTVPGVPYTTLQTYLNTRQSDIKKHVTRFQFNKIYSSTSTCDGSEWDISLLSSLILGMFGTHVRPINGHIKKIRDIRNEMQHSANTTTVRDGDFKTMWDDICTSTSAIALQVKGTLYEDKIKEKITSLCTSTFIPRQGESLRIWYTSFVENTVSVFQEENISLKETLQKNIEEHKQETLELKTKVLEHQEETVKLKEQIVEHRNETVGLRSRIVDQSSELAELREKMVQLQKQSVDIETDCRTTSSILKNVAIKRTSCTGKPTKRFKTLSQSLERMYDEFKKTMNAELLEDVDPPDKNDEILRRIATDRFVVVAGYGKSSYLKTALYVIQSLEEYKPEFCAMITDPTDWKHIEPKELKLVLFKSPFGEGEPNKEKTRTMLDILNNVQFTTKDSEHPLVVIVVTQLEIMQTALRSVGGHHVLLDEPVKLYKENNKQEPDVIDDDILNQAAGSRGNSMKTMLEITKSYREDYSTPVREESVKFVRVKMKESKFVLISGERRETNTAVALRLANDYDDRRFLIVRNTSDISNIDLQNISLLMVEDIAGKYKYDDARLANWLETFDSLLSLVRKGKLNLVATIDTDKMERCKKDLEQHPIYRHEVRVFPNDSIFVKQEKGTPFPSVPTQVPTMQDQTVTYAAQQSTGSVNDLDNTDDEPNGPTMSLNRYWRPITLQFEDGTEADFQVDLPTWKAIVEDKDQPMIEQLVKNYKKAGVNEEGVIPDQTPQPKKQLSTDQLVPSDEERDNISWKHDDILMLLSSYEDRRELFSNSAYTSKAVWKKISEDMADKGVFHSSDSCDKKFRLMKYSLNRYWRPITLQFEDGTEADFQVDLPTWKAIVEDKDQSIIEQLVKHYKKAGVGEEQVIPDQTLQPQKQPSTDQLVPSNAKRDNISWKHEDTLMLLSSYEDRKELFSNSAHKSKDVWKKISEDMANKGVFYSSDACDKKFRSMKYRYRTIMDATGKTGRGISRWEYMERMESLMCKDQTVYPVRVMSPTKETETDRMQLQLQ